MSKRGGGGVVYGAVLAIAAAAGLGMIFGGLTLPAPKPPVPKEMRAFDAAKAGSLPRSEPVKVEIPAIGLRADVVAVGATDSGEIEVPDVAKAPMLAGWYKLGVTPGEAGNAVILGHVDSEKVGPAVFFNLGKLMPGDTIGVSRKDGTLAVFQVDEVKLFPKSDFPFATIYGAADNAQLRLVTCGGELDKKNKNYLSNVVVFASLAA